MVSSLAAQLAAGASANAAQLLGRSQNHSNESYLFSSREAAQHDIDSIYGLGHNGYSQLRYTVPALTQYEDVFFSDKSKQLDRTLIPRDELRELNKQIAGLLRTLSPHLLQPPASRIIEWLVRRFRIHEFNQNQVMACFMPYHDSTAFAKMVSILHIEPNTKWAFLQPFKQNASPVPRAAIVKEMHSNTDLARFVSSILPLSLDASAQNFEDAASTVYLHHSLVAFSTGAMAEYIAKLGAVKEDILAFLLPACIAMIKAPQGETSEMDRALVGVQDTLLAGAILLATLSHRCKMTTPAVRLILLAVLRIQPIVSTLRVVQTIVSILGSQDEFDGESATDFEEVAEVIVELPELDSALAQAISWSGAIKTLRPLASYLIAHISTSRITTLRTLLETPACPSEITYRISYLLLQRLLSINSTPTAEEQAPAFISLLRDVYQRKHEIFERVVSDLREAQQDKETGEQLDSLVMLFSINESSFPGFTSNDAFNSLASLSTSNMLLAAVAIDSSVRVSGVRMIITSLADSAPTSADDPRLDILITRMCDPDEDLRVVEALYEGNSAVLVAQHTFFIAEVTPTATHKANKLIESMGVMFSSSTLSSTSSATLNHHLTFLAKHVLTGGSNGVDPSSPRMAVARKVLQSTFFPLLLFSTVSPRRELTLAAWKLLTEKLSNGAAVVRDLLAGCADVVQANKGDEASLNAQVAAKIAENVVPSNHFHDVVTFLMTSVQSSDVHTRILALLVARGLLRTLSGANQCNVAILTLDAIVANGNLSSSAENQSGYEYNESSTLQAIVEEPTTSATLRQLECDILSVIATIPPPTNGLVPWLGLESSIAESQKVDRLHDYVHLMRALYTQANSHKSLGAFYTHILRVLFVTLGDSVLLFLAGIWSNTHAALPASKLRTPLSEDASLGIRIAALRHAHAFLNAQKPLVVDNSNQPVRDFQTIYPALIIALQSGEGVMRQAALGCVRVLLDLSSMTTNAIYAFDAVYASRNDQVQYLETIDFHKHLQLMCAQEDHILADASYVSALHRTVLQRVKGDGKKEGSRKQRVFCYLLSHAVAWDHRAARLSLLRSLEHVLDTARLPIVFSLLEQIALVEQDSEYVRLLYGAYDAASVSLLEDSAKPYWKAFIAGIQIYVEKDAVLLEIVLRQAQQLAPALPQALKLALAEHHVRLAGSFISSGRSYTLLKTSLAQLMDDPEILIPLLTAFQPHVAAAVRAAKKAKLDDVSTSGEEEESRGVTFLMEVLASKSLPGSLDLIRTLLDVLGRLTQTHTPARSDADYIEQLLLTALESAVANVTTPTSPVSLRIDILVELIRISENPQTFQQALLLASNMARLAPDSVLHTIMPIFTFMGSNVFHRDDSYSFRVVQQTIQNIVPVMVSSLKKPEQSALELYIDSRDFLRVFADAANHVPRHRRNKFFAHLTDTLGPDQFLAPICMLLVDRLSNKIVRQTQGDAAATLMLPLGLAHHYPADVIIPVLIEILNESQRLVDKASSSATSGQATFLDQAADLSRGDRASSPQIILKKEIQSLLVFVGLAWRQSMDGTDASSIPAESFNTMILMLLKLATASADGSSGLDNVNAAAMHALSLGLKSIPVRAFADAILPALTSGNDKVRIAVLDVLVERVPFVASKARDTISATFVNIIKHIATLLKRDGAEALVSASMRALNAIASEATPKEEAALTATLGPLIELGQESTLLTDVLATLKTLSSKLGPRLIPHLRNVTSLCISAMKLGAKYTPDALIIISNLLTSIPSFWGNELGDVISQCLMSKTKSTSALQEQADGVLQLLSAQIPARILLPALVQLWDGTLQSDIIDEFFILLGSVLNIAPRAEVIDQTRQLFRLFLEALDLPSQSEGGAAELILVIEQHVINAFTQLVTKLSEVTFTPLFRKLQDWAWTSGDDTVGVKRKTTFCRAMLSLLDTFKGLFAPYVAMLLAPLSETLQAYSDVTLRDSTLWTTLISLLDKSFAVEEDATSIWKESHLAKLAPKLVAQVAVTPILDTREAPLARCLASLANIISRQESLKKLNLDILMQTRSEDSRVRLVALRCANQAWTNAGMQLSPFVPDCITFIHECAEDENDEVAREARRLKRVLEGVAGPINDDFS